MTPYERALKCDAEADIATGLFVRAMMPRVYLTTGCIRYSPHRKQRAMIAGRRIVMALLLKRKHQVIDIAATMMADPRTVRKAAIWVEERAREDNALRQMWRHMQGVLALYTDE